MAFPTIAGVQPSQQTTNATTSNVTLPGSIAAGDLILAFVSLDSGAGSVTWPAGWNPIKNETGNAFWFSVAYRIATGGETTVAVTHVTERSNHLALRITGWHGTTPPEINTAATGNSTAPNPGTITASWGSADNLFIACFGADDSAGSISVSAYPANYTGSQNVNSTATSAGAVGLAARELASATDDPGAFTIAPSETWSAYTVVVRPAAGGAVARKRWLMTMGVGA